MASRKAASKKRITITPGRRRDKSEQAELAELKSTNPTAFNSAAERAFQTLICKLIAKEGAMTVREVQSEAAFELNLSVETTKRYLLKHTARRAHFSFTEEGKITCSHRVY